MSPPPALHPANIAPLTSLGAFPGHGLGNGAQLGAPRLLELRRQSGEFRESGVDRALGTGPR